MDQKLIVKLLPLEGLYRVGSELRLRSMIRNSFFAIAFSASSS